MESPGPVAFDFDFRSRAPGGALGRAVASAWFARGRIPYRRERVAPTGSTVAVIVLGDPILETAGGPATGPFRAEEGFLIGPHDRPVTNEPTGETWALGVVTTPVGCRAALGFEPVEVAGRVEELVAWWRPARELRARLLAPGLRDDPDAQLDELVRTLEAGLDRGALADPALARAERAIALLQADPVPPIASIAAELAVSHGHLDRELRRFVGLSPRRLARLLRMERLLAAVDTDGANRWADLAADLGWTDQSHLIRDFKRHTASTPTEYLAARRAFTSPGPGPEAARFVPDV